MIFEDIDPTELWFGKNNNHLTIGLVGTQDNVTVSNWFASGENSIDIIQTDTSTLAEAQLAELLQAMSAIGAPAGVNGQWNQEQLDSLPNITSTFWQPKNEI